MSQLIYQLKLKKKAIFILGVVLSLLYIAPFLMVFLNSFKDKFEVILNPLNWPKVLSLYNYRQAWQEMNYVRSFLNSLVITTLSVGSLIVFSSMFAYFLQRNRNKFTKTTLFILVASMIVPFQALMIPFVAIYAQFVNLNNRLALIIFYQGFGVAMSTFLYHGFIAKVPREIDEAASVDGANDFVIFWRIIFPMLKPITATVAIVNTLWIWNDFLLPRLVLNQASQTLPLSTYGFYGQYVQEYGQLMAGLILAVIPIIFLFIFLQRKFISGISAGAVK